MRFWNSQESQAPEESHSYESVAIPHSGALYMLFLNKNVFTRVGYPPESLTVHSSEGLCFHNLKSTLTTKALHYSKHCKECTIGDAKNGALWKGPYLLRHVNSETPVSHTGARGCRQRAGQRPAGETQWRAPFSSFSWTTMALSCWVKWVRLRGRHAVRHPLHVESRKKWHRWTYVWMQSRNSLTDLRKWTYGCLEEEWGEEIVREFGISMYTLLYLKWITSKVLLYRQGTPLSISW